MIDCCKKIVMEEGVLGLWNGYKANFLRNSIMNPFEVTAYFAFYELIRNNNLMKEGIPMYLLCGTLAGINGLCFGNPFDVIRTV